MKSRIKLSLFLLLASCLIQCKKKWIGPSKVLPPITQEGKNTFGCKLNGEIWTPYSQCGYMRNPCGEMQVDVYKTNPPANLPVSLAIMITQETKDSYNSTFTIRTAQNTGISGTGNVVDQIEVSYRPARQGLEYYMPLGNAANKFEVTKLDLDNGIIAGTFDLVLRMSSTDSIKITDGRFDFKFGACKCSN